MEGLKEVCRWKERLLRPTYTYFSFAPQDTFEMRINLIWAKFTSITGTLATWPRCIFFFANSDSVVRYPRYFRLSLNYSHFSWAFSSLTLMLSTAGSVLLPYWSRLPVTPLGNVQFNMQVVHTQFLYCLQVCITF